ADASAHLLDHPGGLVAEHHGQGKRPVAIHDVPVAVTDPGGHHPNACLTSLGALLIDVDHLKRCICLVEHGGFHAESPVAFIVSLPWCESGVPSHPVGSTTR